MPFQCALYPKINVLCLSDPFDQKYISSKATNKDVLSITITLKFKNISN